MSNMIGRGYSGRYEMPQGRERLRHSILRRAIRISDDCRQYRIDVASYNENYNPGPPIDVDPDGEIARAEAWAAQAIDRLEKEQQEARP